MDIGPKQFPVVADHEREGREHLVHAPLNVRRAIGRLSLNTLAQEKEWSTGERSKSVEIRPYQVDAWTALQEHRDAGANNALLHMATGLGKTTVAAGDIASFVESRRTRGDNSTRVLFLAHQTELVRQAADRLSLLLPDMSVSELSSANRRDAVHTADIVCATLQSMHNRLDEYDSDTFDYVVVDESHHAMANNFKKTITHFNPEFRLGVTATPFRADEKDLSVIFGETVYSKGLEAAIAEEWLVTPDYRLQMDDILDEIVNKKFSSMKELNNVLFSETRNDEVARIIDEARTELVRPKTIIFCRDIAHAEETQRFHPDAKTLHSDIGMDERERIMDAFRNGELSKLITVDMFNEGVDVPEANMLIFLRSTASRTIFEQQLGRGLRQAPGKDKVIVLDFVGTGERLQDLYAIGQEIRNKRLEIDISNEGKSAHDSIEESDKFIRKLGFEFTQHQIDVLEYIKQARDEFEGAPEDWVSINAAARQLGCGRMSLLEICEDLGVELRRFYGENGNVAQFIPLEHVEIIKQLLPTIELAPEDYVVMSAVSDELGLKAQTLIDKCTELGIRIEEMKPQQGRIGRYISPQDLETLRLSLPHFELALESDVSMSQMMRILGTSKERIDKVCSELNIPVIRKRTPAGKAIGMYVSGEDFERIEMELPALQFAPSDYINTVNTIELLSTSNRRLQFVMEKLGIQARPMRNGNGKNALYFSPEEVELLDNEINAIDIASEDDVSMSTARAQLKSSKGHIDTALASLGIVPAKKRTRYGAEGSFVTSDQFQQLQEAFTNRRSDSAEPTDVSMYDAQRLLKKSKKRIIEIANELAVSVTTKRNSKGVEGLFVSQEEYARIQAAVNAELTADAEDVSLYGVRETLRQSTAKILRAADSLGIPVIEKRSPAGSISKYMTREQVEQIRRFFE